MDRLLTRFWFLSPRLMGLGVTGYSTEDAQRLLAAFGYVAGRDYDPEHVVRDVDIRTLDPDHVAPNMGPPCLRGVWYPLHNLGWEDPRSSC